MSPAGTQHRAQADLLWAFDRWPQLWARPGAPRHSAGAGMPPPDAGTRRGPTFQPGGTRNIRSKHDWAHRAFSGALRCPSGCRPCGTGQAAAAHLSGQPSGRAGSGAGIGGRLGCLGTHPRLKSPPPPGGRGRFPLQGLVQVGEVGIRPSIPVTSKTRRTMGALAGSTRRSSPASATARLCACTRAGSPAEAQNRVWVMSITNVPCPQPAASARTAQSQSALMTSIPRAPPRAGR
jgi:hypothetical protein